jgi:hypothetical protein
MKESPERHPGREIMTEEILRAEEAIKAGDTRSGFEILREFLADNPDSERAWWVMSGLVPSDQRAHCLEQVLRVNPANQFAREALQKIQAKEQAAQPPQESTPPPAEEVPSPASDQREDSYQVWEYLQRNTANFTILANKGIIYAVTDPGMVSQVQSAVSRGKLPDPLVKNKKALPYQKITRVRQIMSSLRVYYKSVPNEESIRLELPDTQSADQVLAALRQKLGSEFIMRSEPIKQGYALLLSLLMLLVSIGLTIFFLWGAIEVQTGQAAATGSSRTRLIIDLLGILGPLGVGIIGGILILLALFLSARLLFKPPNVTELVRPD